MKRNSIRFALRISVVIVAAAGPISCISPQEHMLRPGEYVSAKGVPLDPGDHAIPCVCDWNNDGRKDLIVGYRFADKIAFYLNQGTDSQPAFGDFVNILAGGADIQHPGSGCGAPAPWVCDYDSDRKKDLLVGTGAEGQVYFYRNTGTDEDPALAAGVALSVGGSALDVGIRATPYVHDWDEDGLNDLLCGDGDGNVHFFRNVGTAQLPSYAADFLIQAGGSPAFFGYRSSIRVCDWDGDGLKDLLGSGANNVSWCKNIGTNKAPSLNPPVRLRAPVSGGQLVEIDTGYRMRLEVVDWNSDGVTDLLIGNYDGRIFYFEGYRFAVTGIARATDSQIIIRWNSADYLAYDVLSGKSLDALTAVVSHLPCAGTTTGWTDELDDNMRFYRVRFAQ